MSSGNGWTRYEEQVLFRLDRLEERLDGHLAASGERHEGLVEMISEVKVALAGVRAGFANVYLRSAAVALGVAFLYTEGRVAGRAAWDLVVRLFF